jgi:hypothetical protein
VKHVRSLGLVLVALAVLVGCAGPTTTGQQANDTTTSEQNISAQNREDVAEQLRFTAKTIEGKDFAVTMKDFVSKYKMGSFTHLADVDASVWQRFNVTSQPAFAFIATDGSVQVVKGTPSDQDLAQRVGTLAAA